MKRRLFVQAMGALPLAAQQPAVPPKPTAKVIDETPALEAAVADEGADMAPRFFNALQFAALTKLSDAVYPKIQDTPGALDAHAPEFLDFLIGASPQDRQHTYRMGLDELNAQSRKQFGKTFADLAASQADTVLAPLREPWSYGSHTASADPLSRFLHAAKDDIMTATINSREWTSVVSKRNRNASGAGTFWYPIY